VRSHTHVVTFDGPEGLRLSGRLETPSTGRAAAAAVFAHCFTCGKQSRAATRISRALAGHGFAVLRYDMPGIGESEGEFADSRWSSRVDSVVAAATYLGRTVAPVRLLIGHSLGGATVLAAAGDLPDVRGVATIAAPFDPAHVTGLFSASYDELETRGEATVTIAGRSFVVRQALVDELADQPQRRRITELDRALLVLHSPTDAVVGIDNAAEIFAAARHPKSFVSLAGADHLLTVDADATYVADVIAAWAQRYLAVDTRPPRVTAWSTPRAQDLDSDDEPGRMSL
jgi:alpha-beta hydrolase superfamily lysophospholipase